VLTLSIPVPQAKECFVPLPAERYQESAKLPHPDRFPSDPEDKRSGAY